MELILEANEWVIVDDCKSLFISIFIYKTNENLDLDSMIFVVVIKKKDRFEDFHNL